MTAALDLAVVRRVLTAALPADLKWAVWVEGRIEEIAAATPREGMFLTPAEIGVLDHVIVRGGFTDSPEDQALAARLEEAL